MTWDRNDPRLHAAVSDLPKLPTNYKIQEECAEQDPYGRTFLAQDRSDGNRPVRIRVLSEHFRNTPKLFDRLAGQVTAQSALHDNENIATLLAAQTNDDDEFYLVSQHYVGVSLEEIIRSGSLHPNYSLRIAGKILSALEAAHREGVVHLDLAPSKIVVQPNSGYRSVLTDFIFMRLIRDHASTDDETERQFDSQQIGVHESLFNPLYVAPEQTGTRPKDERTTHRSDLFRFGVILFELLTGVHPFQGRTVADIQSRKRYGYKSVARYCPSLDSSKLDPIIGKLVAEDPKQRYGSASEVIEALRFLKPAVAM